jgi:alanine-glyoxylate transaminase / serine-glyoxylate transaminase / serine-pyruvate transaminase
MTLSNGRHYLAIPGPSVVPDRVLQAMHRPSPNIYAGPLVDMMPGLVQDLKRVARTRHQVALYIANGHGAWEAAIANVLRAGDRVLLLATGIFGHGWAEIARALGVEVEVLDFGRTSAIDPARVASVLAADKDRRFAAVLATHVDTSTSIRNDIAGLRVAMDETGHPALLMVDCIASLACDRFEMDDWGVDVMVAGSQKGLMTPPGMSFVFFNDKAEQQRARCRPSFYWDWRPRAAPAALYRYFAGTAPTLHLYGLREALTMIGEEGLGAIWSRHERLARAYWAAAQAWGQGGPMRLNVQDATQRSNAVTSLSIGAEHGTRLRDWLSANMGVTLGIGLGMASDSDPQADGFFRLGHMGHVNAHMVLGTIGAIQAGLVALDIPHGQGAQEAAADVCAGA